MKEMLWIVLLVLTVYVPFCLLIALMRAVFSGQEQRKENFKLTFWNFFLEILNPFHWV